MLPAAAAGPCTAADSRGYQPVSGSREKRSRDGQRQGYRSPDLTGSADVSRRRTSEQMTGARKYREPSPLSPPPRWAQQVAAGPLSGSSDSETSDSDDCWEGRLVQSRFRVLHRCGSGSYADCFVASDQGAGSQSDLVCLKIEDREAVRSKLAWEWEVLQELAHLKCKSETRRIPRPITMMDLGRFHIAAMELLGPSLQSLFRKQQAHRHTIMRLLPQLVDCIEYVHKRGILHRDIKPANFLVGLGELSMRLYICDFGLSRRYLLPEGQHVPFRMGRGIAGTARFMSCVAHDGHEQGRRDDVESVGHLVVFLLKGRLPWQKLRSGKWPDRKKKHRAYFEAKSGVTTTELCAGLHPAMHKYMDYARSLGFDATPDYGTLRGWLDRVAASACGGASAAAAVGVYDATAAVAATAGGTTFT